MSNSSSPNSIVYAPSWVSEPDNRGTWSIVYSCIFTLTLCVYSAIHINVGRPGESERKQSLRKAKWVVIAIFAPEVVLFTAWQQFSAARRFCWTMDNIRREEAGMPRSIKQHWWQMFEKRFLKLIPPTREEVKAAKKKAQKEKESEKEGRVKAVENAAKEAEVNEKASLKNGETVPDREVSAESKDAKPKGYIQSAKKSKSSKNGSPDTFKPLSLTYGFYVVMGGLVVDISDIYDDRDCMTLTPSGVIELAKSSSTKEFLVEDKKIKDKSKADNLAKGLVLLQVLWASGQCISRYSLGYPVSVLEVHTLVHACCALLMYALWFRKPLNVREAMIVDSTKFKDELALQMVRLKHSAGRSFFNLRLPEKCTRSSICSGSFDSAERRDCINRSIASEAHYLMFDKAALSRKSRSADESDGQDGLAITHIVEDAPKSDSHPRVPPLDVFCGNGRVPQDLECGMAGFQDRSSGKGLFLREPSAFYRYPRSNAEIVQTLVTGETLPSGIGPSSVITQNVTVTTSNAIGRFIVDAFRASKRACQRLRGLKKLLKDELVEIGETELDAQTQALYPDGSLSKSLTDPIRHRLAISVSKKDLLRWQRVLNAFKREQNYQDIPSTEESREESQSVDEDTIEEKQSDESSSLRSSSSQATKHKLEDRQTTTSPRTARASLECCSRASSIEGISTSNIPLTSDSHLLSAPAIKMNSASRTTSTEELIPTEEALSTGDPASPRASSPERDTQVAAVSATTKSEAAEAETSEVKDEPERKKVRVVGLLENRRKGNPFDMEYLCKRAQNFNTDYFPTSTPDFPQVGGDLLGMWTMLTLIAAAYAGVHLALWNHVFPTTAERYIWLISACCLGIPVAVWAVFVIGFVLIILFIWTAMWIVAFLDASNHKLPNCIVPFISKTLKGAVHMVENCFIGVSKFIERHSFLEDTLMAILWVFAVIFIVIACLAALSYGFARGYIVVESFISIRHVPVGVYQEISWAQYIPHL
ncbi:MAG: hypothetical protein M1820_001759 [Bogoriella megaspora]|nr:MAG: hypothetical protein M1820_001759 [Bogoriella megaspora]